MVYFRRHPGRLEDFDEKLTTVAQRLSKPEEIDKLGKALGFIPDVVQRYVQTNMKNADVTYFGTQSMLRDWRKKQTEATECEALKVALEKAGQIHLADEAIWYFIRCKLYASQMRITLFQ